VWSRSDQSTETRLRSAKSGVVALRRRGKDDLLESSRGWGGTRTLERGCGVLGPKYEGKGSLGTNEGTKTPSPCRSLAYVDICRRVDPPAIKKKKTENNEKTKEKGGDKRARRNLC